jgi:hypothetical protein
MQRGSKTRFPSALARERKSPVSISLRTGMYNTTVRAFAQRGEASIWPWALLPRQAASSGANMPRCSSIWVRRAHFFSPGDMECILTSVCLSCMPKIFAGQFTKATTELPCRLFLDKTPVAADSARIAQRAVGLTQRDFEILHKQRFDALS